MELKNGITLPIFMDEVIDSITDTTKLENLEMSELDLYSIDYKYEVKDIEKGTFRYTVVGAATTSFCTSLTSCEIDKLIQDSFMKDNIFH